jgi:hypothetical protein
VGTLTIVISEDGAPAAEMGRLWREIKATASEYATRGELLGQDGAREKIQEICVRYGAKPPPDVLNYLALALAHLIIEREASSQSS